MNGYEILLFDILIVFFTGLGLREIFRFFSRQYVNSSDNVFINNFMKNSIIRSYTFDWILNIVYQIVFILFALSCVVYGLIYIPNSIAKIQLSVLLIWVIVITLVTFLVHFILNRKIPYTIFKKVIASKIGIISLKTKIGTMVLSVISSIILIFLVLNKGISKECWEMLSEIFPNATYFDAYHFFRLLLPMTVIFLACKTLIWLVKFDKNSHGYIKALNSTYFQFRHMKKIEELSQKEWQANNPLFNERLFCQRETFFINLNTLFHIASSQITLTMDKRSNEKSVRDMISFLICGGAFSKENELNLSQDKLYGERYINMYDYLLDHDYLRICKYGAVVEEYKVNYDDKKQEISFVDEQTGEIRNCEVCRYLSIVNYNKEVAMQETLYN